MNENQKITINDVAKYCGVSATTVSRVINGTSYVSSGLKKKILEYINDCGWQCSSLRHKLSGKAHELRIALIVNRWNTDEERPYFFEEMDRQQRVLREAGFEPLLSTGSRNDVLQKALDLSPALVVINGINDRLTDSIRKLREAGIPVIAFGIPFNVQCPCISHDYKQAGGIAAQMLLKGRPERIGVLSGISNHAHPDSIEKIPVRAEYDLVKGIIETVPEFNIKQDLVSDCFCDYSEFRKMLHSGKYFHWIISRITNYLAFTKILLEFPLEERKRFKVIPILENEMIPVPVYFRNALFYSSQDSALKQFLKKHPTGDAEPQEIMIPLHKNGEW